MHINVIRYQSGGMAPSLRAEAGSGLMIGIGASEYNQEQW